MPTPQPLRLFKRDDDQICNLCLQAADLTDDHVPTQAWGNNAEIIVRRLNAEAYIADQVPLRCKKGVFFRTLCKMCNSSRLGSVDAALSEFVSICRRNVERERSTFVAELRPNAILRSILGHILAVRTHTERGEALDCLVRDYLIDGKPLSPRVHVYVWRFIMPNELIIARDLIVGDFAERTRTGILGVIKFYPIAAVVQLDGSPFDAPSFAEFEAVPPDERIPLLISFSTPFNPKFPEQSHEIEPRYFVMAGKGYTDGIERASAP